MRVDGDGRCNVAANAGLLVLLVRLEAALVVVAKAVGTHAEAPLRASAEVTPPYLRKACSTEPHPNCSMSSDSSSTDESSPSAGALPVVAATDEAGAASSTMRNARPKARKLNGIQRKHRDRKQRHSVAAVPGIFLLCATQGPHRAQHAYES